jgi:predicted nucleic-acid-binding protein
MKYALDTSVVMRLLISDPTNLHHSALNFLDTARETKSPVWVSDLVISEVYFALQHHYGATKSTTIEAIRRLLLTGEIQASGHVPAVLKTQNLASAKPGFVDLLIHAESNASNCTLTTFEKAASKLIKTLILKEI